jgi:hypothetical protein
MSNIRPRGLCVLVAGPDGVGKSSVAKELVSTLKDDFANTVHLHCRPSLLPRPGSLVGLPDADTSDPHSRSVHGPALSLAVLMYHWVDFVLGGWMKVSRVRRSAGLVVIERGWLDMAVDPVRYRLSPLPGIVRFLGRLGPQPDIALILEAPPDVLHLRKAELPATELSRQCKEWHSVLPRGIRTTFIDTSSSFDDVVSKARQAITAAHSARPPDAVSPGWTGLPLPRHPRWILPRGPRSVAHGGLRVYHPVTIRGRVAWEAGRLMATLGGFRMLRRADFSPWPIDVRLDVLVPNDGGLAVSKSTHTGRFIALILDRDGNGVAVAKLATDDEGRAALAREAHRIRRLRTQLKSPLVAPKLVGAEAGLLILESIAWRARVRPWRLPPEVARGLGHFFGEHADDVDGQLRGPAHGDFAPWNLLRTGLQWAVLDWEDSWDNAPPFFDIFHYLVQAHALLGRPSKGALVRGLHDRSWIHASIESYAAGAGLDGNRIEEYFIEYLEISAASLDGSREDHRRGLIARIDLLESLGSTGSVPEFRQKLTMAK